MLIGFYLLNIQKKNPLSDNGWFIRHEVIWHAHRFDEAGEESKQYFRVNFTQKHVSADKVKKLETTYRTSKFNHTRYHTILYDNNSHNCLFLLKSANVVRK